MTAAELQRLLRDRRFPPLLLLYGEESYLIDGVLRQLRDRVVAPEARDFNLEIFSARDCRAATVLDAARTFPVFSSHRLVIVRDLQQWSAAELDACLTYLTDPAPETVLVLCAEKIDGRRKFFQEFKKRGAQVEFKPLREHQLPAFVTDLAREAGFSFTEEALALFCRRVGCNLYEVDGELAKLRNFLGEVTVADVSEVRAVVSDGRIDNIFELTEALGRQDAARALPLLRRLLADGVAPLVILSMITRHFRQLWMARELLTDRHSRQEMAARIGIHPFFLDGLLQQAREFPADRFRPLFELLLATDLGLKSSGPEPAALLEGLVLHLGGSRRA